MITSVTKAPASVASSSGRATSPSPSEAAIVDGSSPNTTPTATKSKPGDVMSRAQAILNRLHARASSSAVPTPVPSSPQLAKATDKSLFPTFPNSVPPSSSTTEGAPSVDDAELTAMQKILFSKPASPNVESYWQPTKSSPTVTLKSPSNQRSPSTSSKASNNLAIKTAAPPKSSKSKLTAVIPMSRRNSEGDWTDEEDASPRPEEITNRKKGPGLISKGKSLRDFSPSDIPPFNPKAQTALAVAGRTPNPLPSTITSTTNSLLSPKTPAWIPHQEMFMAPQGLPWNNDLPTASQFSTPPFSLHTFFQQAPAPHESQMFTTSAYGVTSGIPGPPHPPTGLQSVPLSVASKARTESTFQSLVPSKVKSKAIAITSPTVGSSKTISTTFSSSSVPSNNPDPGSIATIVKIREQLTTAELEKAEAIRDASEKGKELAELEGKLQSEVADAEKLRKENEQLKMEIETIRGNSSKAATFAQKAQQEMAENHARELSEIRLTADASQAQASGMVKELIKLEDIVAREVAYREKGIIKIKDYQLKISRLELEVGRLTTENQTLAAELAVAQGGESVTNLFSRAAAFAKSRDSSGSSKLQELSLANQHLHSELDQLRSESVQLKEKVKEGDALIGELMSENERLMNA